MSEPPLTTEVGRDLYEALAPLTYEDEAHGWALAHYVDSLAIVFEETANLVRSDDDDEGWTAFADPERCPDSYLTTLAQWAGIRWPNRLAPDDLRTLIGGKGSGLWRGTKSALIAAVRRYMTPGGSLYFEERADGDPYKLRIFTYGFDTLDEAAIRTELLLNVPAGLLLDYDVRVGQTYGMASDRTDELAAPTYADATAVYATYEDAHVAHPPPD